MFVFVSIIYLTNDASLLSITFCLLNAFAIHDENMDDSIIYPEKIKLAIRCVGTKKNHLRIT